MKTNPSSRFQALWAGIVLLCLSAAPLCAEEFGLFTYSVVGGTTIEITDYPQSAVGPAEIPAMIDGKSVTSIGTSAFRDCSALTSVTIPEGVTSIGDWAFYSCNSLTSVTIPEGVTSIGQGAFANCSALTSATIPSSVTSISYGAFFNCNSLTSVTIPEGVTSIGNSAFENCSALTSVTIPEGVTSIGDYAFLNCNSLTMAVFLGDAPSLGSSVFSGTAAVFTIYYLSGSTGFTTPTWGGDPTLPLNGEMVFGLFAYRVVGGTTIEITDYPEVAVGPAEIPAMIDGKSVTSIGNSAFKNCSALTSVTIPEGVTSIGTGAFENCNSLTSVTIPSSVTSIGNSAFSNCSALTVAVFLGDAPSLGSVVFSGTAAGFTIYYRSGSTGFTTPTWEGYPALPLDGEMVFGLVAYYPFNGNANDESGNGNNGTVNGATLTTDRNGNTGSAYDFDGTDDFIVAPIGLVNQNFTYSAWIKAENPNSSQGSFGCLGPAGPTHPHIWNFTYDYTAGSWDLWHYDASWYTSDTSARDKWVHVVVKYEGTNAKLYVNGLHIGADTGVPNPIPDRGARELYIGRNGYLGPTAWDPQVFKGQIDDVRIYNRALSQEDVSALYDLEKPTRVLTVSTPDNGTVTGDGTYGFGSGAVLEAIPALGYLFTTWTDDASGNNNPLALVMYENQSVGAIFEPDQGDPDQDGLSNYQELIIHGTDPDNPDTDGDGVYDGIELADQTDPNDPNDYNFLNSGLVAYYPFNGNANDESGNENNGTVNGATLTTDRNGNADNALLITTDQGNATSAANIPISGNADRTISFWCKFSSPTGHQPGVQWGINSSNGGMCHFSENVTAGIWFWGHYADNDYPVSGAPYDQWRHLVFVYHSSLDDAVCYANGNVVPRIRPGALNRTNTLNTISTPLKMRGVTGDFIDDVRIYNRTLSGEEVTALYNLEKPTSRRYVRAGASGANDGSSWADAYTDLQAALTTAISGDEIWVAAGTYRPTANPNDRTASFAPPEGVKVCGGFDGTETSRSQRDWRVNRTILTGDLSGDDTANIARIEPTRAENSIHVITVYNKASEVVLDGLVVTGGNADTAFWGAPGALANGGGLRLDASTLTIRNCIFEKNTASKAASLYDEGPGSTLRVENSIFRDNVSHSGGTMHVAGDFVLESCVIYNNQTKDSPFGYQWGGGLFLGGSSSGLINNSVFANNYANESGGAIFGQADAVITNCSFYGHSVANEAGRSGQTLRTEGGTLTLKNCIIWGSSGGGSVIDGSTTITNSTIQGGHAGAGNLDVDPQFVSTTNLEGIDGIWGTADDGLHLQNTSPAVDTGLNADAVGSDDLTGRPRIVDGNSDTMATVDMGAYELEKPDGEMVFGLFSYRVVGGTTIEITDYPEDAVGPAEIPAMIDGKPVTSIGNSAFKNCSALTSVTIPSSVISIGDYAFYRCRSLTSVTIPEGVTSIGQGAFYRCRSLTSVTIPEGVTSIGEDAFDSCSALTSVTIPSSVTSIGEEAFEGCSALTSVTIPEGVTSIGGQAFQDCSALTSVTISSSVTSIGNSAFEDCSSLTSIVVAPENSNFASEEGVLFNATKITLIHYPGGKAGPYIIPSSVTSIGEEAFEDCSALTSVTIPEGVTSIGEEAFEDCSALTSVTIPSSVTSIGESAFEDCSALTSVTIPEGVTSIGGYAFANCSALTSVTIPSSVSSISYYAFSNCSALTEAVFLGDAPSLGSSVFSGTAAGFTIDYLSGSTGLTTPTWEGYAALPIDEALYPAASWLLGHRYPHTTNLHQDTNGDGVSLLMAYALNLNPNLNLADSLPAPVLGGNTLSMSFHAASPGITYRVETSIDLNTWVTEGVTMSGPDNQRTASVAMDLPQRFLRLVVQQELSMTGAEVSARLEGLTVYGGPESGIVGDGVEIPLLTSFASNPGFSIDFGPKTILIKRDSGVHFTASTGFNGLIIEGVGNSLPTIFRAHLTSSNVAAFSQDRIGTTSNQIRLNFESISFGAGAELLITVAFGP